uniref:Uncharacterized protein n=1 Tax=Nothobranchius furzeri TaxID=105023 RepID=A0A1A8A981_NOTFU
MEKLSGEMECRRAAVESQVKAGDNLGAGVAVVDHRLRILEGTHNPPKQPEDLEVPVRFRGEENLTAGHASEPGGGGEGGLPRSPTWSTVVKRGAIQKRGVQREEGGMAARPRKEQRENTGIVGTGVVDNNPVIRTKLASVFATRFSPTLEADTLASYLSERLGRRVTCWKISSSSGRFGSVQVSAEYGDVSDMYDPQLWPAGTYVRRLFEPSRRRFNKTSGAEGELQLQPAAPVASASTTEVQPGAGRRLN